MGERRYVVGEKRTTRGRVIVAIVTSIILGGMIGLLLNELLNLNLLFSSIFSISIVTFLLVPVVSTTNRHWDLKGNYFEYRYFYNHLEEAKYALDILIGKRDTALVKINLETVELTSKIILPIGKTFKKVLE